MERTIDRFDAYMASVGLNDNKVTVQLGFAVGLIGKSRKPGRDLSRSAINKILEFYTDLNSTWLLTGEGSMLNTEQPKLVAEQIPSLSNVEILLRDMLAEERAKNDTLQELIWELKEENGRLKEQLRAKGGDVRNAVDSSSAVA